jgi:peptidoglycan/LPS O-acetylase OafA/YrhL
VFVTLGRRSLGAFVLHVYGLLMLTNVAVPDGLWINTLVQIALVLIIAALLNAIEFLRHLRRHPTPARPQALAA